MHNPHFMTAEEEARRFRKQFTDREWDFLIADKDFKTAWDSHDFITAGARANVLLNGDAGQIKSKKDRQIAIDLSNI